MQRFSELGEEALREGPGRPTSTWFPKLEEEALDRFVPRGFQQELFRKRSLALGRLVGSPGIKRGLAH
jgi:hypothetical protein